MTFKNLITEIVAIIALLNLKTRRDKICQFD